MHLSDLPARHANAHPVPDAHGQNLYQADPVLARLLPLYLPADLLAHLQPTLQRLGGLAGADPFASLGLVIDAFPTRVELAAAPETRVWSDDPRQHDAVRRLARHRATRLDTAHSHNQGSSSASQTRPRWSSIWRIRPW